MALPSGQRSPNTNFDQPGPPNRAPYAWRSHGGLTDFPKQERTPVLNAHMFPPGVQDTSRSLPDATRAALAQPPPSAASQAKRQRRPPLHREPLPTSMQVPTANSQPAVPVSSCYAYAPADLDRVPAGLKS